MQKGDPMKEKPIIFNGPMVRAILEGRKTQTRRPVKPQPTPGVPWRGPIAPGDVLWVRETWWDIPDPSPKDLREGADTWPNVAYPATDEAPVYTEWGWKKRPSIHMPRWASRITLEVTDVRVERVQEITEEDCQAEGVLFRVPRGGGYRRTFEALWGEIYPDSWGRNEWVWVIEFRRVKP